MTAGRTVFNGMTQKGVESLLRKAWASKKAIRVQGDRVLFEAKVGRDTVQFWFNKATRVIETVYPR